ncbi:MAG TPA: hypothetical protein VK747_02040 [Blastocatellia bacterium]|nr:hypothetical protein [Blastocatellia bacterium]
MSALAILSQPRKRYGKTYLKMDDGFLRDDARKDIGALLDWIQSQPDLDPLLSSGRG